MATAAELRRLREEQSIFAPLYEAARQQQSELAEQGRRPVFGGLLSKEPVYGTDTLRYEGIGNMLAGLLSPAAKAVDAPISAYRGTIPQEDMISEALGVGGLAMAGGGVVGVPRGAVGANALRGDRFFSQDEIDIYTRQARNPKSRETLTYMSPQDFLALAKKTTAGEKTEKTRKLLREGTQFESIPFLSVQNQGGGNAKVVGHEGRNRMMALAEAGVESVPVRLNMTGGGSGPSIRWGEALDPNSFDYVDSKDIPVRVINEDENMVYSMPDSVVSPITQAAAPSSDLLPLGGYRKPEGRLSKDEQDIEDQISESILFDILRDYDTTAANASKSTGLLTSSAADLRRQANIDRFGYDPNEAPEVDTSYRGGHQPVGPQDENPVRLDDVTISTTGEQAGYPSDFYSSQGQRQYAQGPRFADDEFGLSNQQSYRAIQAARGNPDAEVTIYRGVPNEGSITSINAGDFVTLSPKYAELHASSGYGPRGEDAGKVISQKVKVKDVYFAGDDVNEFGYFPDTTAANVSPIGGLLAQSGANQQSGPVAPNLIDEYLKSRQARR